MKIGAYGQMMFELEAEPTHGQIVPFSFWPPPHLSFGSGQSDTGNLAERERERPPVNSQCTQSCRIESVLSILKSLVSSHFRPCEYKPSTTGFNGSL